MTATRAFAGILGMLGVCAVAIGCGIFLLGPAAIANAFARLIAFAGGADGPVDGLAGVNVDNEMRFYSVMWVGYGALAIRTARRLPADLAAARILLAIFFAGGVGRALSLFAVGAPHPLFYILMWIELFLPPALLLLSLRMPVRALR